MGMINKIRVSIFYLCDIICVGDSISCWYGQGGDWINIGFPMYTYIEKNPEKGWEI